MTEIVRDILNDFYVDLNFCLHGHCGRASLHRVFSLYWSGGNLLISFYRGVSFSYIVPSGPADVWLMASPVPSSASKQMHSLIMEVCSIHAESGLVYSVFIGLE